MIKDLCTVVCRNKNLLMLLTAGIYILALYSALSGHTLLFSVLITFAFAAFLIKDYFKPKYILIWILIFYFGIYNTTSRLKDTDELLNLAPVNSVISGQILSIPQDKGKDKISFFFKVNKIEYDGNVREFDNEKVLVTLNTNEKLKIYDYYKIKGRLSVPFKAGNPSQFDYGNYLRNFNVYAVFYGAKGAEPVFLNSDLSAREKVLQWINDYREKIISIHSNYLTSPNLEILGGIVFGDDAVSPPENIKQSFINSGLLHILAASGMNVAFIFSFFFFFLSALKVNYKVNISAGIVMVIVYSLMTGLGASVVRATFMLVFVLIGKLIDRDAHSISLLAFVAFLMLLYNPMYINDVGFQLSFIVTFGLLIMTPFLMRGKNKFVNWVIGTVSIPIIAQLWVMPIQIFYFNNISLYSVFANIMSVPILSVISFGGFVSSLIATITPPFICRCFDFVLNPMLTLLVNISDFWGKLPNAAIQTTHPSVFQIILYYAVLLLITALMDKNIRENYLKPIKLALPVLMLVLCLSQISFPNHNLEITAFDVGNADAFLIKTPDNKYLMIDTAKSGYNGGKSQAKMLILKYLMDRGIKNIDTIIVTHFDNDHCGGAVDLMEGVSVKNLYVNSLNHDSNAAKQIYKRANLRGVKLILAENNQTVIDKDGLVIRNYICNEPGVGDNESSVLTLLHYKNFSMLFTGDSGVDTFMKLKNFLPQNITVLKVGHHGANGVVNKEMLEYLNPKYALISTGINKFGHPTIYTVAILRDRTILRTDINNSIRFVVNDKGYNTFVFDTKKKKYIAK
ncbi:TPA: DNA internalization-related competence protein ComEC/Rec2 [Candidatus Gastranaerophilales bacterium HUM_22]|nr:MAG TPA: DNA internalization-related competence protein ComEC/Rec2 [Candidatus Gastranaerophilales bacterium HUM_22]